MEDIAAATNNGETAPQREDTLADLLDKTEAFLRRYVAFPSGHPPTAIALWIAHTYAYDHFDVSPFLHVASPEKRSGKTRLLETLEVLVREPWRVVLPTEAVLYRKIQADHPTLLLDEVDTIFGGRRNDAHEGLRALLNAGNRRGVKVARCEEVRGKINLVEFSVFAPRVLAGIGTLPDTVADRSIPIRLKRRAAYERVERFKFRDVAEAGRPICEALERWSLSAGSDLDQARPVIPPALNDRAGELWEPLLAIADLAGVEWPRRAREAALALHADPVAQTETGGVQILAAIRGIFDERGMGQIPTSDLLTALVDRDDAPAAEWWSRALNDHDTKGPARRLATLLKPYGIEPTKWGSGKNTVRGYRRADFDDAWSRYLPPTASFQTGGSDAANAATPDTQGAAGNPGNAADSLTPQREALQDEARGVAASTPPVPEGDEERPGAPEDSQRSTRLAVGNGEAPATADVASVDPQAPQEAVTQRVAGQTPGGNGFSGEAGDRTRAGTSGDPPPRPVRDDQTDQDDEYSVIV